MSIKVIAFDLFGTVFDADSADADDRARYGECLMAWRKFGIYEPVKDVESFRTLKPFADSVKGLQMLRDAGYLLVAASNIPTLITLAASSNAGISWDAITPLDVYRMYKPSLAAYAAICDAAGCSSSEVLMVTGNHGKYGIGDDTEPLKIGMQTAKIRRDSPIQTIDQLLTHHLSPLGPRFS